MILRALVALFLILTTPALAGQENVAFPLYQNHVLYTVLDQPDLKELREAYINPEAFKALQPGQSMPYGTIISLPTFKALVDEKGELVKDPNGRLVRGRLDRVVVMEKRQGWGA